MVHNKEIPRAKNKFFLAKLGAVIRVLSEIYRYFLYVLQNLDINAIYLFFSTDKILSEYQHLLRIRLISPHEIRE